MLFVSTLFIGYAYCTYGSSESFYIETNILANCGIETNILANCGIFCIFIYVFVSCKIIMIRL